MRPCAAAVAGRHKMAAIPATNSWDRIVWLLLELRRAPLALRSHRSQAWCLRTARIRIVIKVGTWNVNGIRARQAQLQDWIDREKPDIVCLQEIKASPDQ